MLEGLRWLVFEDGSLLSEWAEFPNLPPAATLGVSGFFLLGLALWLCITLGVVWAIRRAAPLDDDDDPEDEDWEECE